MRILKKIGAVFTLTTLLMTSLFVFPLKAEAKKKPYMKDVDVRWNLKPDKEVSFKTKLAGYGNITLKAKVKDFEIRDLEDGRKEVSFKIEYRFPKLNLNKKQVYKISKDKYIYRYMWTVLDYDSGLSLENANNQDVIVEYGDWEHSEEKYHYKGDKGSSFSYSKFVNKEVNVTYPKDYKGLCLVVGGYLDPGNSDDDFFSGKIPFMKSGSYKKGMKDLSCFMRIKDVKIK